jgi:hypothetical protein
MGYPPVPVPPVSQSPRGRGWWRRNVWGLLALLPVLAIAIAPGINDWRDRTTNSQFEPRQPIAAAMTEWAAYAGGEIRLLELAPADLTDYSGKAFDLPEGLQTWRAVLEFRDPDEKLGGCDVSLEDTTNRIFDPDPAELRGADKSFGSCSPGLSGGPPGPSFRSAFHFVLPVAARPAAIRFVLATQTPNYLRFAAPPS